LGVTKLPEAPPFDEATVDKGFFGEETFDKGLFGDESPGFPGNVVLDDGESVDCEVFTGPGAGPVDADDSESSAYAMPGVVTTATPKPRITTDVPRRPTRLA
jgi:hypothetical protein